MEKQGNQFNLVLYYNLNLGWLLDFNWFSSMWFICVSHNMIELF